MYSYFDSSDLAVDLSCTMNSAAVKKHVPSVYCSVDSSLKTVPPSVIHLHMLLQCAFCVTLISLEHLF